MLFLTISFALFILVMWFICAEFAAVALRRAFRHRQPTTITVPASDGPVLNYAPPASATPWVEKRPWIAAVAAVVNTAPFVAIPAIVALDTAWIWPNLGGIAASMAALGVVGLLIIAVAAVRRRHLDAQPAAVTWRLRPWGFALLALVLIYTVVAFIVDTRIIRDLRSAAAAASEALHQIQLNPGDADAGNTYAQAGAIAAAHRDLARWEEGYDTSADPSYIPPPPFAAELQPVIPLLYQAASADSVDFGLDLTQVTIDSSFPHLAQSRELANLLRWHALDAARAGDWDQVVRSLTALRSLARHVGERTPYVGVLVAIGVDVMTSSTIEQCLPFVTSEAQLDQIPLQPRPWYTDMMREGLSVKRILEQRELANLFISAQYTATPAPRSYRMLPPRLIVANSELSLLNEGFDFAIARVTAIGESDLVPPDPPEFVAHGRGAVLTPIMLPSLNRAGTTAVRARTMNDLAQLAIAITRHRLRTGALPRNWDELLQAGLISSVPLDPWDGQPLRFISNDDEVVIYSIGDDRVDDGGRERGRTRDVVFRVARKPLWELHPPQPIEEPDYGLFDEP